MNDITKLDSFQVLLLPPIHCPKSNMILRITSLVLLQRSTTVCSAFISILLQKSDICSNHERRGLYAEIQIIFGSVYASG